MNGDSKAVLLLRPLTVMDCLFLLVPGSRGATAPVSF